MNQFVFFRSILIGLLLFLLAACTLPGGSKVEPTTSVEQLDSAIDTAVQQTLAALPTRTAPVIVVLTTIPTNTLAPTAEPTATPAPTATLLPSPTATIGNELITGKPGTHFLHIYFDAVVRGDYASAWNNLTPAFKTKQHDDSLADFTQGYQDMKLCDIEISDITIVTETSYYAKIAAHFVYKTGANCVESGYDFYAHYYWESSQNRWLLDGLTKQ